MKALTLGVQDFYNIATRNLLYVDKTEIIYNLIQQGFRYFLSRPRRFGKSLLLSTLREIFSGNKELFKGLWIYNSDYNWKEHPIIFLDFSVIGHEDSNDLKKKLSFRLKDIGSFYNIDLSQEVDLDRVTIRLIESLAAKFGYGSIVILIDEYDKPILDHIQNIEEANAQRDVLRVFYESIKGLDKCINFVFITGITKFCKASIFSGSNNLNDITLIPEVATLLGYTEEEIDFYFRDYIEIYAKLEKKSFHDIRIQMRKYYNGYRFSQNPVKVYNPYSVISFLRNKVLTNYWYKSGSPSFFIPLLEKHYEALLDIDNIDYTIPYLDTIDLANIPLVPMLFQAGYLTINKFYKDKQTYGLSYPNKEVRVSFLNYVIAILAKKDLAKADSLLKDIKDALKADNINKFCLQIESLFASIPYNILIKQEKYFHSLFHITMNLLSMDNTSEVPTNRGRIDSVVKIDKYIYIFEFKCDCDALDALRQIEDRIYYQQYQNSHKNIVLVGISYNLKDDTPKIDFVSKQLNPN